MKFSKKYAIIVKKFVRFPYLLSLIGEGGDRVTDFEKLYNTYYEYFVKQYKIYHKYIFLYFN